MQAILRLLAEEVYVPGNPFQYSDVEDHRFRPRAAGLVIMQPWRLNTCDQGC